MHMSTALKQFYKTVFYAFWDATYAFFSVVFFVVKIAFAIRWLGTLQSAQITNFFRRSQGNQLNP